MQNMNRSSLLILLSLAMLAHFFCGNPVKNEDVGRDLWTVSGNILTDPDGNIYSTVIIGSQIWTVENLRTTKLKDGTAIPQVKDGSQWSELSTPGYCFYENRTDTAYQKKYGALYNWYVVKGELAPKGWRVPTDADWDTLRNYLIANGYNYDGTKSYNYDAISYNKIAISMAAQTDWSNHRDAGVIGYDLGKNNASGFSALPGGLRYGDGGFDSGGDDGNWWSSTEEHGSSSRAFMRGLSFRGSNLGRGTNTKSWGFSIRLVRN